MCGMRLFPRLLGFLLTLCGFQGVSSYLILRFVYPSRTPSISMEYGLSLEGFSEVTGGRDIVICVKWAGKLKSNTAGPTLGIWCCCAC